ncbi:hypothetical protein AB0N77_21880 [Streptomyces misionensis]|uniref:hypothetical protein n=1 Tax=Streptomyces misionensis TaxID=67331 RepID=UPI003425B361
MYIKDVRPGLTYERADGAGYWTRVKVTRIWPTSTGTGVAFDILGTDRRGRPNITHSVMPAARFTDAYRPDAETAAILYATLEDAQNAANLSPDVPVVVIEIEYARAKVGRWLYDGKISRVHGGTDTFEYHDRRGRKRSTRRFTLVS